MTTSAAMASARAFITKQSRKCAQFEPRQFSRVDVTSGQIEAFSGTSASRARSPRSEVRAKATILRRCRASSREGTRSSRDVRSRW